MSAYESGRTSRREGQPITASPHTGCSQAERELRMEWRRGWQDEHRTTILLPADLAEFNAALDVIRRMIARNPELAIGRAQKYSDEQVDEYGILLAAVKAWIERTAPKPNPSGMTGDQAEAAGRAEYERATGGERG